MVADGVDDDEDDISGFLLGLAISRAILGGSWVLDFHHWWYIPGISCLLRHAGADSGSILLTPKPQGFVEWLWRRIDYRKDMSIGVTTRTGSFSSFGTVVLLPFAMAEVLKFQGRAEWHPATCTIGSCQLKTVSTYVGGFNLNWFLHSRRVSVTSGNWNTCPFD